MQLLKEGGVFIYPLLLASVIGAAIIGERLHIFRKITNKPLLEYDIPEEVVMKLRSHLSGLHTIVVIAPMLGLLGTVTGLMRCFRLLGNGAGGYQPQEISLGISEALITTAIGLIIAVVATIFYNYFVDQIDKYVQAYNVSLKKGEYSAEKAD